ncbi:MAG: helix-turn-helix domain-containing protein [Acidobacteriia bacterium]|jgi:predicted DNA-binding transcriptional regulator AlpA|nr:helix-turn-helix domain-containing protein [Terriglobia bacterium]
MKRNGNVEAASTVLLDEQAVAERLGVTRNCLAKWRCQGRGPAFIKIGRLVRYKPEAIEKFLDRRTVEPGR